jgi:hypothetical protein
LDADDFSLKTTVGCPAELCYRIGTVLETGKAYLAKEVGYEEFEEFLAESEQYLRHWDINQDIYPTPDPEWKLLADAYRHACLLRILRSPDSFPRLVPIQGSFNLSTPFSKTVLKSRGLRPSTKGSFSLSSWQVLIPNYFTDNIMSDCVSNRYNITQNFPNQL